MRTPQWICAALAGITAAALITCPAVATPSAVERRRDVGEHAGIGFCSTLTSCSAFNYGTHRLYHDGAHLNVLANITISLAGGLSAALGAAHSLNIHPLIS